MDSVDEPDPETAEGGPPEVPARALGGSSARDSIILVVLFVGAEQLGNRVQGDGEGLKWAIAAATAWGIYTMIGRWRRGLPIGKFLPIILVALVARGALGIIFDSKDVYFGLGIATKVLIGLTLIGSCVIRRPLAGVLLPYVFPFDENTKAHPIYHSTMVHLTLLAASYQLLTSVWDVWLLSVSTASGYVTIRSVVGVVTGFGAFFAGFFYARRRLDQIPGFEGVMPMLERMSTEWARS